MPGASAVADAGGGGNLRPGKAAALGSETAGGNLRLAPQTSALVGAGECGRSGGEPGELLLAHYRAVGFTNSIFHARVRAGKPGEGGDRGLIEAPSHLFELPLLHLLGSLDYAHKGRLVSVYPGGLLFETVDSPLCLEVELAVDVQERRACRGV